jgi:hypothetical protein
MKKEGKDMIEVKNIKATPVEERAKQVERLKDKLYAEIGDCRQGLLEELSGFFQNCPKGTVETGVMSDDTYDIYRSLIDQAHDLEELEDYIDMPDAFQKSYDEAYRMKPWEDDSFSLGREKVYVIPDTLLDAWLQDDFHFVEQYLSMTEKDRRTEPPMLCDQMFCFIKPDPQTTKEEDIER